MSILLKTILHLRIERKKLGLFAVSRAFVLLSQLRLSVLETETKISLQKSANLLWSLTVNVLSLRGPEATSMILSLSYVTTVTA